LLKFLYDRLSGDNLYTNYLFCVCQRAIQFSKIKCFVAEQIKLMLNIMFEILLFKVN